jgi:hypothetical protein
MSIENRINKLEGRLGVNQEPENLEQMIRKLNNGGYDGTNTAAIVYFIMSGGSWDRLRDKLPDALIAFLQETMAKPLK